MEGRLDAFAHLNEANTDIIDHQFVTRLPRLFSQTTSYLYSKSHLIVFQNLVKKNQYEKQKNSLIDLYINHNILLKNDARILLPTWINCLRAFRQLLGIDLINRVLATGLLLIIDEVHHEKLNAEFKTLLYLFAREKPQLANSVLAQFARIKKNDMLLGECQSAHKLSEILNSAHAVISINEIKMLITPFIESYKEQNYLSPLINVMNENKFYNVKNYLSMMHGLLKKIPSTDELWTSTSKISALMHYLLILGTAGHTELLIALFVTIQSRILDKHFLVEYQTDIKYLCEEDMLVYVLEEADNHRPASEQSIVALLFERYYPMLNKENRGLLPAEFFSRMQRYLNRLEDENHLINGINMIFPHLKGAYQHTISLIIADVVPKISSTVFLGEFILKLSELAMSKLTVNGTQLEKLAVLCALPQLDENTVLIYFKMLHDFHLEKDCSPLSSRMMTTLCLGIKSVSVLDITHEMFTEQVKDVESKLLDWFVDAKNFMYFECSMIFLAKKQLDKQILVYFNKIELLYIYSRNNDIFLLKLDRLVNRILPYMQSIDIFTYLAKEGGLIEGILKRMLNNNMKENGFFESISMLMLKLPHDRFKKVSQMLLATKDSGYLLQPHIKKYAEEECTDDYITGKPLLFTI